MAAPGVINTDAISGTSDYIQTLNTGGNLSAQAPDAVRKIWARALHVCERNADPYMDLEGSGMGAPIWTETSTSAGKGQTVTFTEMAQFGKLGKQGDSALFLNPNDYEPTIMNTWQVQVDVIRNAWSHNERMEEVMGMRGEIASRVPELLGEWLGNRKAEDADLTLLLNATPTEVSFANGRSGFSTLTASDTLSYNDIIETTAVLKRFTSPAEIRRGRNGNKLKRYLFMGVTDALTDLKVELVNSGIIQQAASRGDDNMAFSGNWVDIDGQTIRERENMDESRPGAIGSALNPKAYLGVAVSAGTATFDIKGSYNANWAAEAGFAPFRHFTDYAYRFVGTNATFSPGGATANTPGGAPAYVIIYNLSGADRGKYGVYAYNANDGEKLTVSARLGSAASGIRATTVGGITWDSSKHTDAHPEGSLVIPITGSGSVPVPYCYHIVLGSGALLRAYGKDRARRGQETAQDFVTYNYLTSYFGHGVRRDVRYAVKGYRVVVAACRYADIKLT